MREITRNRPLELRGILRVDLAARGNDRLVAPRHRPATAGTPVVTETRLRSLRPSLSIIAIGLSSDAHSLKRIFDTCKIVLIRYFKQFISEAVEALGEHNLRHGRTFTIGLHSSSIVNSQS